MEEPKEAIFFTVLWLAGSVSHLVLGLLEVTVVSALVTSPDPPKVNHFHLQTKKKKTLRCTPYQILPKLVRIETGYPRSAYLSM